MENDNYHTPVLLNEVIELLFLNENGVYVDATVGTGGHSEKILEKLSSGTVVGIDQDEDAIDIAKKRLSKFNDKIILIKDNFSNLKEVLNKLNVHKIDGILFDLGVSSLQLGSESRGFSFNMNSPLDMRMDKSAKVKAHDLVNFLDENELADIIYKYGEERFSRRIAKSIVNERVRMPISTTKELEKIIISAIPYSCRNWKRNPATKTFQALRIAVNNELDILSNSINDAITFLKPTGRICVISFHSLEDRCVKNIFKNHQEIKIITKKPIVPSFEERKMNPRSRSAKLRCGERNE